MTETIHDLSGLRNSGYGVVQSGGAVVMDAGGAEGVVTGAGASSGASAGPVTTGPKPPRQEDIKDLYASDIDENNLPTVGDVSKYFKLQYSVAKLDVDTEKKKDTKVRVTRGMVMKSFSYLAGAADGKITVGSVTAGKDKLDDILSKKEFVKLMEDLSKENIGFFLNWGDVFDFKEVNKKTKDVGDMLAKAKNDAAGAAITALLYAMNKLGKMNLALFDENKGLDVGSYTNNVYTAATTPAELNEFKLTTEKKVIADDIATLNDSGITWPTLKRDNLPNTDYEFKISNTDKKTLHYKYKEEGWKPPLPPLAPSASSSLVVTT